MTKVKTYEYNIAGEKVRLTREEYDRYLYLYPEYMNSSYCIR